MCTVPSWGGAPDVPLNYNYPLYKNLTLSTDTNDFPELFMSIVDPHQFKQQVDEQLTIVSMKTNQNDCNVFNAITVFDMDNVKTFAVCISFSNLFEENDLNDNLCSLFDLAENILCCKKIIIFVEKFRTNISELVRAFGYVGFTSAEYLVRSGDEISEDYCLLQCEL